MQKQLWTMVRYIAATELGLRHVRDSIDWKSKVNLFIFVLFAVRLLRLNATTDGDLEKFTVLDDFSVKFANSEVVPQKFNLILWTRWP